MRLARKIASGNVTREIRVRRLCGHSTLWTRSSEAEATCQRIVAL
jgi:hypothetical protein